MIFTENLDHNPQAVTLEKLVELIREYKKAAQN